MKVARNRRSGGALGGYGAAFGTPMPATRSPITRPLVPSGAASRPDLPAASRPPSLGAVFSGAAGEGASSISFWCLR